MMREFHKDELDAVMQLWLNAVTKAHPFIPRDYWLNQYKIVRNDHLSMAKTFVYGEHGRLKGFVSILEDSFIAELFVDADNWNQGIGTKLIEWCKEQYPHLEVNVYKQSENTVHFYEKHGFIAERELKNSATGADELFMSWKKEG
ncbi:N-acetyltransferase [Clostridium minihomine]|uniref:N-acetyltransferase n=1 Tax=Clostridium minihomine TaxID=2045012 RepID=UPI000C76B045|nr:N-acetyltransferase [Clostridium minihomine]